MKSKNHVDLIGHIGASPVAKYTSNGTLYVYFSLATSHRWRNDSGDVQQNTEWHNIVAYGRLAEILRDYTQKGSAVAIEGRLRTRPIPNTDGQKPRYVTEIVVEDVNLLDKRPAASAPAQNEPAPADVPVPEPEGEPEGIPF